MIGPSVNEVEYFPPIKVKVEFDVAETTILTSTESSDRFDFGFAAVSSRFEIVGNHE